MPKKGQFSANATADSKRQRKFNGTPAQKKRRAQRNAARRKMVKAGRVKSGQDVDHKNKGSKTGSLSNKPSNLRARSASSNRADNRGTGGRKPKRKPTRRTTRKKK